MNSRSWLAFAAALLLSGPLLAQDKDAPGAAPPADTSAAIDAAISNGLVWLCRHQDADGAWRAMSIATHCDEGAACFKGDQSPQYDGGLTALAVLALLGTGASPDKPVVLHGASADVTFDARACCQRGVAWLIANQDKNGSVTGAESMYVDCLAAIALCEAARVGKDYDCKRAAQRAVDYVEAGQASSPSGKSLWGWRYVPKERYSDTSVTGWAVQAFESARRAGIHVPMDAMAGALDFIEWATAPTGGVVGYLDPAGAGLKVTGHNDSFDYHVGTMSAIAIQVRLRADTKPDKAAAEWLKTAVNQVLLKDLPSTKTPLAVDYYYWHQAAEAWSMLGARGFKKLADTGSAWRSALIASLLSLQAAPSAKCSSGAWLQGDRWAYAGGPVYCTAINVLTLERLNER